jgi:hypothetical protein
MSWSMPIHNTWNFFSTCPTNEASGIGLLSGSHGRVETGKPNMMFHANLCFSEKLCQKRASPASSLQPPAPTKISQFCFSSFDQPKLMEVHGYISNFTKFNNKRSFYFLFSFVASVMQRLRSCLFGVKCFSWKHFLAFG